MTLKIETQEDEQRQLAVTIEVDEKRVRKAMQKAAKKHARSLRIPGFRPGKAPYGVVVGYIGLEAIQQDALNEMLPLVFNEALEQIEAEPYAQPSLDDVVFEPMVLKMTVPLTPVVELGDYRAMRREIELVEVKPEAVEEALDALVQQQATTDPVERAAESGDELVVSGTGYIEGEATEASDDDESEDEEASDGRTTVFQEDHFHVRLDDGNIYPDTSFIDELVGLSAEESKTFTVTFPEDYSQDESLAGKTATFEIKADEVLVRSVPELNDEFAASQTGDAETVEELRAETADRLQKQAEEQYKNDLIEETVGEMLENVESMTYPPGAVEVEIDEMVRNLQGQMQQIGIDWEMYLNMRQESEASLREEFEDDASNRLERRLVFQQFVEAEKLTLEPAEIEAAVEERLQTYDAEMQDYMRPFLEGEGGNMLRNEIMMDKIYDRFVAVLTGIAPSLEELEAASDDSAEASSDAAADSDADAVEATEAEAGDADAAVDEA